MKKPNTPSRDAEISIRLLVILGVSAVIITIIFAVSVLCVLQSWEVRGQFGDMFGGLNALFSGLAFAGVVYAILLQRKELALQRDEMDRSRQELAAQNQLLAQQLSTMQASFNWERNRQTVENEPVFVPGPESGMANYRWIEVTNVGGRISNIEISVIEPPTGIGMSFERRDVLDRNSRTKLEIRGFGGNPCPKTEFEIHYTTILSERRTKRYILPASGNNLQEVSATRTA